VGLSRPGNAGRLFPVGEAIKFRKVFLLQKAIEIFFCIHHLSLSKLRKVMNTKKAFTE